MAPQSARQGADPARVAPVAETPYYGYLLAAVLARPHALLGTLSTSDPSDVLAYQSLLPGGKIAVALINTPNQLLLVVVVFYVVQFLMSQLLAPVLMGICRLLLYLVASSTALNGVTGWSMWSGLALALYIVGLSSLARRESARGPVAYWPAMILAAPILLALLLNANDYRQPAWLLSAVLALWILRSLRQLFRSNPNVGRVVSSLLAGIVFVDWLAVADAPRRFGFFFIAFFLCALLLQRIAPAT